MKTKIIILLITIAIIPTLHFYEDKQKFQCIQDEDCIMSYRDYEAFQICVNNIWYEINPTTREYQCIIDQNLTCTCQNSRCTRTGNSTNGN